MEMLDRYKKNLKNKITNKEVNIKERVNKSNISLCFAIFKFLV